MNSLISQIRGRYDDQNYSANCYLQGNSHGGLRNAHGLEKAPIALWREGKYQREGRGKIHSVGIPHFRHQPRAEPGKRLVQAWRATGWWPDYYSIAIFDIEKVGRGSKLQFTQVGVPASRYSGHYRGWIETYWTPMKEVFANGEISEKTRARVKIDRTARIETQHFRRKMSTEA